MTGGGQNDVFNIGSATNSLSQLAGAVTVTGGANLTTTATAASGTQVSKSVIIGDTLNINDQGDGGNYTYSIGGSTLTRTGAGTITFATIETLALNTSTGNDTVTVSAFPTGVDHLLLNGNSAAAIGDIAATSDTFNVQTTGANTVTEVTGGAGNDTFTVSSASNNLDNIVGAVSINGGANLTTTTTAAAGTSVAASVVVGDTLNVTDSSQTGSFTYGIGAHLVSSSGVGGIAYQGIETLALKTPTSNDTVNVGTATLPTGIGTGANPTGGASSAGHVLVTANSSASTKDTVNVRATAANSVTEVTTGAGNDIINAGFDPTLPANGLGALQGVVSLNGGANTNATTTAGAGTPAASTVLLGDTLNLDDQGDSGAYTYGLASSSVTRTGAAAIAFQAIETLVLNSSTGNDTVTVSAAPTGVDHLVLNGSGTASTTDTFNLSALTGTAATDITGAGAASVQGPTFNAPVTVQAGSVTVKQLNAGSSAVFLKATTGSIHGSNNGTDITGGNVALNGKVLINVNSPFTTAGTDFDQLVISETGTIDLSGATLNLGGDGAAAPVGTVMKIIDNKGSSAVTPFSGLAEGASVSNSSYKAAISYVGGDGNDVVLRTAPGTAPDIDVQGKSTSIVNGSTTPSTTNDTDFGSAVTSGGTVDHTFTIKNTGTGDLTLSGNPLVAISGTNAGDFSVTTQPTSPVTASNSTTFTVRFTPSATGQRTATLSIVNSVSGKSPFTFAIQGTGTVAHFSVSAPATATAGSAFNYTVTALDPSNNTVTGYNGTVHFTSTDGNATLPADSTLTNGVGTFSATLKTAGNQTITATDMVTSSITGTSATIAVSPAAATHFSVSAPATAGTALSFTVTALDQFNNTATTYGGAVHFTSTDGNATLPANSTLTNGVGTFSATLKTAGNQTITATDTVTSSITGTSNSIMVNPAAATHFSVSAPATATAGSAFNFTVTALDQFNNTATTYGGTVHFTSTDGNATLPANSTLTNGVGTFSATLKTAGSQTITATDTVTSSITGTSNTITVSAGAATHFSVSAPATATAGTAFNFTVTALDQFNNTVTSYAGTVHFTSTDGQGTLPANSTLTNGVGTFSATLKTAGSQTITATDTTTSSITGTSGSVAVVAGAASLTTSTITANPTSITADGASTSTITVQLEDANNNNLTTSGGTVTLSTTAGALGAVTDNANGTYTATLTSATTTGTATISGKLGDQALANTATVAFTPGAASLTKSTITANPTSITADGASTSLITVQLIDANGNKLTNSGGPVTLSTTAGTLGDVTNFTDGTYSATLTSSTTAGTATISGTLNNQPLTNTAAVTFTAGPLHHFDVSLTSPQISGTVFTGANTLTAKDVNGNTITTFDASANNVTLSIAPNDGTITGLGSGSNAVLNQTTDFVSGVANVTGKLTFTGTAGNHTFTATSADSKTGASGKVTINARPNVTTQPTNQTVCDGASVSFTAAASGAPTPTVQWQASTDGGKTFNNITGAISTIYTHNAAASENGNQYRAVFTNAAGTANSNAAKLTVNTAPAVTTNPTNQTVTAGQSVSFTAAASGSPTPTVQWQVSTDGGKTFNNIDGATSTTYTHNTAASESGNQYRAVFTNTCSTATTTAATLTVNTLPAVTTQPTNQTICDGASVSFTAAASGAPTPTVQWQVSTDGTTFTNITGATSTTYTHNAAASENGNQYRAVFTNAAGKANSNAATLTVNTAPAVTTNPANQTVTAGQSVSFTAAASGSPTPTVQWQVSTDTGKTFNNIDGATATTYTHAAAASESGNQYRAVFTNTCNTATTTAATLTVNTLPTVTTQPTKQTVCDGASVSFTAAASGAPTPTVQWQVSTDGGKTFSNINGATAVTYTHTAALSENGNQYRAVFTNAAGTANSNAATLTVSHVTVSPATIAGGVVGSTYTATTFTAAGGTAPYTLSQTGTLPNGMTFANGVLSGTPTQTGNFPITVTAVDANKCVGSQDYVLVVTANPTVISITPKTGLNNGPVNITSLKGTGFMTGATVKLTRTGQSDLNATAVQVVDLSNSKSSQTITCIFDLTGAAAGLWNVVVTDPDGESATLTNGFTVITAVDQPGALIKLSSEPDCAFPTDNAHQTTPSGNHVKQQTVQTGKTATYDIQIVNDGNTTRTFVVKATETTGAGWSIAYKLAAGTNVTTQIESSAGWTTGTLTPGDATFLTVAMTPGSGVKDGATKGATLNVYLTGTDTTVRDSVEAITKASSLPGPTLTGVSPNTGDNTGIAAVSRLDGTGIQSDAVVKLTRCGQQDIVATSFIANKVLDVVIWQFNIIGQKTGPWDVVVTNPDGQSARLRNGFTITSKTAPAITRITPNSARSNGPVSVTITGNRFQPGAAVKLTKSGQSDIVLTSPSITTTQITGSFDLTGKAAGARDVVVTNPDSQTATLTSGFTVLQTGSDVHDLALTSFTASPNPVSRGATVTFSVTIKNVGTVSESGVTFRVTSNGMTLNSIKLPVMKPGQQTASSLRLAIPRNTPPNDYLVTGEVSTVPGETNTTNNSQTVKLTVK